MIGKTISHYRILGKLGEGYMGMSYGYGLAAKEAKKAAKKEEKKQKII